MAAGELRSEAASVVRRPGTGRALVLGAATVAAAMLAVAGAAFACSPTCCFVSLSQTSGGPESRLTVHGTAFYAETATVRWGGADGQVLATPTGQSWDVTVTVPDVAPGYYSVFVQSTFPNTGEPISNAPTFHVTAPTPAATVTETPGTPGTNEPAQVQPAPAAAPQGTELAVPATAGPSSAGIAGQAATGGVASPVASRTGSKALAAKPAVNPAAVSVAPVAAVAPALAPVAVPVQAAAPAPEPSTQAAVEAGTMPLPWGAHAHSSAGLTADKTGHEGPLRLGLALLGVGLAGLLGGLAVLGVRRPASGTSLQSPGDARPSGD